jgi:hypothetical protein
MPINIEKINEIYQNRTIDDNEKERQLFNHLHSNFSFGRGRFPGYGYDTKKNYITDLNGIKDSVNSGAKPIIELICRWFDNYEQIKKTFPDNASEFPPHSKDGIKIFLNELERVTRKIPEKPRIVNKKNTEGMEQSIEDMDAKFEHDNMKEDDQSDDDEDVMLEEYEKAYEKSQVKASPQLPPGWQKKWSKSKKRPYYEIRDSETGERLDWSWKFPSAEGGSSKKTKKRKSTKKIKRSKKSKNSKRRTLRKR